MQLHDRRALLFSTVVLCVVFSLCIYNDNDSGEYVRIGTAFDRSLWCGMLAFLPSFVGSSFGLRLRPLETPGVFRTITAALLFIALSAFVLWTLPGEGSDDNGGLWGLALWCVMGSFGICYGLTYLGPGRNA